MEERLKKVGAWLAGKWRAGLVLGTAALGMTCSIAQAADVPRFEVEAHCEEVAGIGAGFSQSMFNRCMSMEQSSYDQLKGQWGEVPQGVKEHCVEVATVGGSGSYSMLQRCVKMETDAAQNQESFQY